MKLEQCYIDNIVRVALSRLGQEEKKGNSGFKNAWYEKKMRERGWEPPFAWCMFAAEEVYKEALPQNIWDIMKLDEIFSGSATETLNNARKAGHTIDLNPALGSLAIWQKYINGKADWTGHGGIPLRLGISGSFSSFEGNTNDKGGREGYITAIRPHNTKEHARVNGLKLIGFIHF